MIDTDNDEIKDDSDCETPEWRKLAVAFSSFIDSKDKYIMEIRARNFNLSQFLGSEVGYYPISYKKMKNIF